MLNIQGDDVDIIDWSISSEFMPTAKFTAFYANIAAQSYESLFCMAEQFCFINIEKSMASANRFACRKNDLYVVISSIWNVLMGYLKPEGLDDRIVGGSAIYDLLATKAISLAVKYYLNMVNTSFKNNLNVLLFEEDADFQKKIDMQFFHNARNTMNCFGSFAAMDLDPVNNYTMLIINKLAELKNNLEKNCLPMSCLVKKEHKKCVGVILHVMTCILKSLRQDTLQSLTLGPGYAESLFDRRLYDCEMWTTFDNLFFYKGLERGAFFLMKNEKLNDNDRSALNSTYEILDLHL